MPSPEELRELSKLSEVLDGEGRAMLAAQLHAAGQHVEAAALAGRCLGAGGVVSALSFQQQGLLEETRIELQRLLGALPFDPLVRFTAIEVALSSGELESGRRALQQLVEEYPALPGALARLAQLWLPGADFRQVLRDLHRFGRPRGYLEVGVAAGRSLRLAHGCQLAVGVDPAPEISDRELPSPFRLHRQTSSAFFSAHSHESVFGACPLDLVFLDGDHQFEQALEDLANVLPWCHPDTVIAVHDCLAVSAVAAEPERRSFFWVGDVWRALEALVAQSTRPPLSVVACYPSGLLLLKASALPTGWRIEAGALAHARTLETPPSPPTWRDRYPLLPPTEAAIRAFCSIRGGP